jgi:hypothetical protein
MTAHVGARMSAYIDRELTPSERAGVEVHLRECAECARAVEEMRAVDALARGQDVEAPAGYFEALPGQLRTRLAPPARGRVPAWAVALAAGLAVAVLAPIVMRDRPATAPLASSAPSLDAPARLATEPTPREAVPAASPAPDAAAEANRVSPETRARVPRGYAANRPVPQPESADRLQRRERADEPAEGGRAAAAPPVPRAVIPPTDPAPAAGRAEGPPARERHQAPAAPGPTEQALAAGAVAGVDAAAEAESAALEEDEESAPKLVDDSATERDAEGRPVPPAPRRTAAKARPGTDARFRSLSTRATRNAAEARALRDAWAALVRDDPEGPHADQARVHALEAGAAAWRLGRRPEDRAQVERDARAYLLRSDSAQKERVRALLAGLEP